NAGVAEVGDRQARHGPVLQRLEAEDRSLPRQGALAAARMPLRSGGWLLARLQPAEDREANHGPTPLSWSAIHEGRSARRADRAQGDVRAVGRNDDDHEGVIPQSRSLIPSKARPGAKAVSVERHEKQRPRQW